MKRTDSEYKTERQKLQTAEKENTVTVVQGTKAWQIQAEAGKTVMELLKEHRIFLQAPCGGTGKCGKCKVRITKGAIPVTESERQFLTPEEQGRGIRLACYAIPGKDCTVTLEEQSAYVTVSEYASVKETPARQPLTQEDFGIAVDIGTTTVALKLIGLQTEQSIATVTLQNHQSVYGADVISRIQAANHGNAQALRNCIQSDLQSGIRSLLDKARVAGTSVKKTVIAANTTMVHLLLGYSCETLGIAPFAPVSLEAVSLPAAELLGTDILGNCPAWIFPGISAYVGGDIVAGLLAASFDRREKPALFLDLGTNGEMALCTKDGIVCASAAAGPAFEGGNLSSGVGSIEGAVCSIQLRNGQPETIKTIGDAAPCGICGTGVVELVAELLKEGLIDGTGLLTEEFFETGFPVANGKQGTVQLTQKDIREVQLAKAAICAGLQTLLAECGMSAQIIDAVYVAGGFGYYLQPEKAIQIGLLPNDLAGKITAVGNSALQGAVLCLLHEEERARAERLCGNCKEISLSENRRFQELYIQEMLFSK